MKVKVTFLEKALPEVKNWIQKQFLKKLVPNYYTKKKIRVIRSCLKKVENLISIEKSNFQVGVVRVFLFSIMFFLACMA